MCTNNEYIKQQIETNELIYIDTCSLLDIDRLNNFLKGVRTILIENKKKIIVHYSVLEELYKFRFASNEVKRNQANDAIDIILNNSDIFIIESNPNINNETECFADLKLLTTLFERRRNHKQLLISNDNALTTDAFNFNSIESVRGNRINVCYLNHYGNMNRCKCVKEKTDRKLQLKNSDDITEEPKIIVEKEVVKEELPTLKKYGIPTISLLVGGFLGCIATTLLNKK